MLSYGGRKIVPAPTVSLTKNYRTSEDGIKLGTSYDIALTGTLLPFRGSPSGHYASLDTAFWTLGDYPPDEPYRGDNEDHNSILRKQEALRWLFSRDGCSLEWQPSHGQPVVKCNPRVLDISFQEGTWADRCPFTIRLQAEWVYINGTLSQEDTISADLLSAANETWAFEEIEGQDGKAYRVTHEVTANGLVGYDETGGKSGGKDGWEHARDWCNARTTGSVDSAVMLAAIGTGSWVGGQYTKSVRVGKTDGTYGITETWTISPSPTFIEKTFNVEYDQENDEYRFRYDGVVHAVAEGQRLGSIQGLNVAKAGIPDVATARTEALSLVGTMLGGKTLGSSPDVRSVALNQREGTASFTYEWSTAVNPNCIERYEANLTFNSDTGYYTLTLTADLQGKGETAAIRLANARAAIPSDAAARAKALAIIGNQLPDSIMLSNTIKAKATSINEAAGRVSLSWTWDSTPDHNLDVSIQFQNPAEVVALIPIPGRPAGPIIQDMNTVTEKTASVTVRGKNYAARPSDAEMLALCHSYLGVPAAGFIVTGDSPTWNPISKSYERTVRYLIREGY